MRELDLHDIRLILVPITDTPPKQHRHTPTLEKNSNTASSILAFNSIKVKMSDMTSYFGTSMVHLPRKCKHARKGRCPDLGSSRYQSEKVCTVLLGERAEGKSAAVSQVVERVDAELGKGRRQLVEVC